MLKIQSTGELNHTGTSRGFNCRRHRRRCHRYNEQHAQRHLNNKFSFWRQLLYILNRLRHGCVCFLDISFFMSQQNPAKEKKKKGNKSKRKRDDGKISL